MPKTKWQLEHEKKALALIARLNEFAPCDAKIVYVEPKIHHDPVGCKSAKFEIQWTLGKRTVHCDIADRRQAEIEEMIQPLRRALADLKKFTEDDAKEKTAFESSYTQVPGKFPGGTGPGGVAVDDELLAAIPSVPDGAALFAPTKYGAFEPCPFPNSWGGRERAKAKLPLPLAYYTEKPIDPFKGLHGPSCAQDWREILRAQTDPGWKFACRIICAHEGHTVIDLEPSEARALGLMEPAALIVPREVPRADALAMFGQKFKREGK